MSEPGRRGRATKYSPLFPAIAREYFKHGYTNAQLGKLFDAAPRTVTGWIKKHEEFRKACQNSGDTIPN